MTPKYSCAYAIVTETKRAGVLRTTRAAALARRAWLVGRPAVLAACVHTTRQLKTCRSQNMLRGNQRAQPRTCFAGAVRACSTAQARSVKGRAVRIATFQMYAVCSAWRRDAPQPQFAHLVHVAIALKQEDGRRGPALRKDIGRVSRHLGPRCAIAHTTFAQWQGDAAHSKSKAGLAADAGFVSALMNLSRPCKAASHRGAH